MVAQLVIMLVTSDIHVEIPGDKKETEGVVIDFCINELDYVTVNLV